MYNMAAKDPALAEAIAQAIYDVDPEIILFALAGSESVKAAEKIGLKVASEVFADRSYQEDGSLTPRTQPGAMITDEDVSIAQVLSMVLKGQVTTLSGKVIPVKADTICVHGDGGKGTAVHPENPEGPPGKRGGNRCCRNLPEITGEGPCRMANVHGVPIVKNADLSVL